MSDNSVQLDLLSSLDDLGFVHILLEDLHHDLRGKVRRFRHLSDLSAILGTAGTLMPGGEVAYGAWLEARASFIHGNYIATVMLCQSLAEHLLASHISLGLEEQNLPRRMSFSETLNRCVAKDILTERDADDLRNLMALRNPLSHYRDINDPQNLSRRVLDTQISAEEHLRHDATFAVSMAIRLMALPAFRIDEQRLGRRV